jgi:hypothetical protein
LGIIQPKNKVKIRAKLLSMSNKIIEITSLVNDFSKVWRSPDFDQECDGAVGPPSPKNPETETSPLNAEMYPKNLPLNQISPNQASQKQISSNQISHLNIQVKKSTALRGHLDDVCAYELNI